MSIFFLKISALIITSFLVTSNAKADLPSSALRYVNNEAQKEDYHNLFKRIIDITERNYVEDTKKDKLFYSAFDGMLSSLDPHSGFLNEDDFKEMSVQTSGEFGGVGIEITISNGLLKVVSPIDDTPA